MPLVLAATLRRKYAINFCKNYLKGQETQIHLEIKIYQSLCYFFVMVFLKIDLRDNILIWLIKIPDIQNSILALTLELFLKLHCFQNYRFTYFSIISKKNCRLKCQSLVARKNGGELQDGQK